MNPTSSPGLPGMRVRRIVTGHDEEGKAVVVTDEEVAGTSLAEDGGQMDAAFFHLWATHEMPVDLTDEAAERQRDGSTTTVLGSGQGSVLRLGILAAGMRSPMHRTASLDYGICLVGECDLELDSGQAVTVHAGDVVVQRGDEPRVAQPHREALPVRLDPARCDATNGCRDDSHRELGGRVARALTVGSAAPSVAASTPMRSSSAGARQTLEYVLAREVRTSVWHR